MTDWPYSDPRWVALRKAFRPAGQPCAIQLPGCTGIATCLDHYPIEAWQLRLMRPDLDWLAFHPRNLRGACQSCNTKLGAALGGRRQHQVAKQRKARRAIQQRRSSRSW